MAEVEPISWTQPVAVVARVDGDRLERGRVDQRGVTAMTGVIEIIRGYEGQFTSRAG